MNSANSVRWLARSLLTSPLAAEANELQLEHQFFLVARAIEEAVQSCAPEAHAKGIEIVCETWALPRFHPYVGDGQRLKQVTCLLVQQAVSCRPQCAIEG